VFAAMHSLALGLTAAGIVDGLRIDHPDGLRDPAQYFARLQQGHLERREKLRPGSTQDEAGEDGALALYVVAEKITAAYADQPAGWRLHGTTGYRFGVLVNGLFVDRSQAARMERVWRAFSGVTQDFEDMVFKAKRAVATGSLGAELTVLTTQLKRIAGANRRTRDFGFNTLRDAIADTAACMPVYRTYVVDQASEQDVRYVDWAIAHARRRSAIADGSVFDFLRHNLLGQPAVGSAPDLALPVLRFAWRFQQFCAPVSAKGVEDCAFYRYLRLVSLNEVGGDPETFGVSVAGFHGASISRAANWPHTMLATSTHDNKRSEDVRNRIDVLSERSALWRLSLKRWHQLSRSFRTDLDSGPAPSRADELLLYQTLLGSLPAGELDEAQLATYRERIVQYMTKAAREAQVRTSWMQPDEAYEDALAAFVRGVLGRLAPNPVLADLRIPAAEFAWFGALNSLSMTVIKYTSPGVPDMYQGNELIDLSLVDPDNRRPVDYALRARYLAEHQALLAEPQAQLQRDGLVGMLATPTDGRLKLWATWRLLALRRECPALFDTGEYIPLKTSGAARDHILAYARRTDEGVLIVLAGRLYAKLMQQPERPPVGDAVWGDTSVDLTPALRHWSGAMLATDVLSLTACSLTRGPLRMADAFALMPAAALWIDGRVAGQSEAPDTADAPDAPEAASS
jgi:(1->4)-alpha-D-glucan 1-alpha-D-glucosylmutase